LKSLAEAPFVLKIISTNYAHHHHVSNAIVVAPLKSIVLLGLIAINGLVAKERVKTKNEDFTLLRSGGLDAHRFLFENRAADRRSTCLRSIK